MKWVMFWRWGRRVRELEGELAAVYERLPAFVSGHERARADLERLMVLAGTRQEDPLWKTVLSYADEHARNERDAALAPALTDGERQYRAGRAAGAEDFATALRALRVRADAAAGKVKGVK
jgi:hypothetical protein